MTKTQQLRAKLIARGFAPMEHASRRECLKGKATKGGDLYIWLDKTGGGRHNTAPKITDARPLSQVTLNLVLNEQHSNLIASKEG